MLKIELKGNRYKGDRQAIAVKVRELVDAFIDGMGARSIAIDDTIGESALDAMATYGKIVAYPADLNVGALPPAKLALPVEVARYFVWGKFGQHATPARVTLWKHGMGRFGQSA
ncbi:MAG: hypothetical protein J0I98_19070 [Mesorhizobium sp.]|nr:hypothetical protein [Mesorhizobium sp.]MBN9244891.1 hypothetical protein [Mesorhizobium sp.]